MADRIHEIKDEIDALVRERQELILDGQIEAAAEHIATMLGQDWSLLLDAVKDQYRDVASNVLVSVGAGGPAVIELLYNEVNVAGLIPDLGL